MKNKKASSAPEATLQEQVEGLLEQRDFAVSEVQRVRKQRDHALQALEFITRGTRCVECGGEDQAYLAKQALAEIDAGNL
jgi:hypothetical protein